MTGPLLHATDVAERLSVGLSKAYELLATGVIPSIQIGKSVRVDPEVLEDWLISRTTGGRDE